MDLEQENNILSGGTELSFDIPENTMKNIKEALGINELENIHKRFKNGTETINDIMYHCLNYGIGLANHQVLKLVETKYFDKLVQYIEKQSKMIEIMAEQLATPTHDKEWVIKYFEEEVKLEEND